MRNPVVYRTAKKALFCQLFLHMRIRYRFLADLHVTRHTRETGSEKRIRNTQTCRVELVTSPNRDYRP